MMWGMIRAIVNLEKKYPPALGATPIRIMVICRQSTENVSVIIGMINEVKRREWEEELKETEEKKKSE